MTNKEVLSLLNAMKVEQETLRGLWGQFSGALTQVATVIDRYETLAPELEKLETRKREVEKELAEVMPKLELRKMDALKAENAFKASLDKENEALREAVASERARLTQVTQDTNNAIAAGETLLAALDNKIEGEKARLAMAESAFAKFRKEHGL